MVKLHALIQNGLKIIFILQSVNLLFNTLTYCQKISVLSPQADRTICFNNMIKNKTKSKQIRPQSGKNQNIFNKKTQPITIKKKYQQSPLRPASQQYHTSLTHNLLKKHYVLVRNNLSSQKKKRKIKQSTKTKSNEFKCDLIDHQNLEQQYSSKQKSRPKQLKSKKQNILKKQPNLKQQNKDLKDTNKDTKQNGLLKVYNRDKKQKQNKSNKLPLIKAFIGSKLRKKLENYLLFINLINYSIRIKFKAPQIRRYKVYIEKGNNSKLVRQLFNNRFWWEVVTKKPNPNEINLVWSQWSKPHIFNEIPKLLQQTNIINEEQVEPAQSDDQNKQEIRPLKTKQLIFKKFPSENSNQIQGILDLFSGADRKKISKRTSKKQVKLDDLKQLVSKQNRKLLKKTRVKLTHNHIQNHQQLTNKKNLFNNLKDHYQEQVFRFIPLTYHVSNMQQGDKQNQNSLNRILQKIYDQIHNNKKEEKKQNKQQMWIVKPGENSNRGCGIQVFKKIQNIKSYIERQRLKHPQRSFIVQKYLNPFLYHRRKFDLRCYLLITATPQVRAYYYPVGYIRTSSYEFSSKNCSNKFIHLTNDAVQKKQQQYGKYQKGNKVTYEQFQNYLDLFQNKKQLNFYKQILPKIQQIMYKTVNIMVNNNKNEQINSNKGRKLNPHNRQYSFELYGYDFMIDQTFNPWLIQINTNPCIQTGCQILQQIIPNVLQNVLKICVDTAFPPPKLEDWPLNQILTCPEKLFEPNQFYLLYNQLQD